MNWSRRPGGEHRTPAPGEANIPLERLVIERVASIRCGRGGLRIACMSIGDASKTIATPSLNSGHDSR
jgi:hypothetical protein